MGRAIKAVHVADPAILEETTPQGLGRRLHGRCFGASLRRGKYLFVELGGGDSLVLHFGMTGSLAFCRERSEIPEHTACTFEFEDGSVLCYVTRRKLGFIAFTGDVDAFIEAHHLGPDALSLDADEFVELAQGRRGRVKSWLMNQDVMAGIGNAYADEILLAAGVHPECVLQDLDEEQVRRLHQATREVLRRAVDAGADPKRMPEEFILPAREEGARCPRCGGELERLEISGRPAWYCPDCQPRC